MNTKPTDSATLHRLIDAWFDGTTTVDEERTLRVMLAKADITDPEVSRTAAVMGLYSPARLDILRHKAKSRRRLRIGAALTSCAAAAAAILLLLPAASGIRLDNPGQKCYAIVDGHQVTDPEVIDAMLRMQLDELSANDSEIDRAILADLAQFSDFM